MDDIIYKPIGVIHSPFKKPQGTPIQPTRAQGIKGTIEVFPEYAKGLQDIEGFSHIIVLFHFHLVKGYSLTGTPFLDNKPHGIFAIRGPSRPNPIGVSIVRLINVENNILHIQDLDIIDGTPLLDLKPYVPELDRPDVTKRGWLEGKITPSSQTKDDGRFIQQ